VRERGAIIPKIDTYTAQGRQAVLSLPAVSPDSFGHQAFGQLSEFGQKLQEVSYAIQSQRDQIQLTDMASQLDLAIPQAQQTALQHPIVSERPQIFQDEVIKARERIAKGTESSAVHTALLSHQQRTMPQAVLHLQQQSMVQMQDDNNAMLTKAMNDAALKIPTLADPAQRVETLGGIRKILDDSTSRKLMTKDHAEKTWATFQATVMDKQMDYLRQTDPQLMRTMDRNGEFKYLDATVRLKHLAQASDDAEKDATYQEKAFTATQHSHELDWSAQANQGRLSDFQLSEALAGRNRYITPDKAREYAKINASPPDVSATAPSQVIMQQYHGGPITRSRIAAARNQLTNAAREMGRPSAAFDKALNELQADEMSMRTVDAAEKTANIQNAKDQYQMDAAPKLPGMIGTFQKNVEEKEKAEIQLRVRKGEKPEAVIAELKKRHEAQSKAIPERSKSVLELVQ
jgi:hypothetical protein